MTYAIAILRRAQRELQRLPHEDYERVREAIRTLAQNPSPPGCLALTGHAGWRIRVGNYRYNAERRGLGREFREEVQRVLDFLGASSMCATAHTKYTPEALLSMPDGDQYELVDGELVERQMGFRSSRIGGELFGLLRAHCRQHQLGWVLPSDAGYQCFPDDPSKVRKPDVSFIQAARLAVEDEPEGWATIAPDLAVEVVSPNDLFEAVSVKVREYLAAGVRLVWVIDTATQMVYVYPHDRRGEILTQADDLSGEDVVEGFHCRVADLFAPPVG